MPGLYRTAAGREAILAYYDRSVRGLGLPFTDHTVPTRFGHTHVLAFGPLDAPPVVIPHGGNVINPVSLAWFVPLMQEFRIYAPDTMGHPGKSAETRLSGNDLSYGQWLADMMDGLGLDRAAFVAPSFAAGMTLRLAAYAPERISRAALIVPSSFGLSPGMAWKVVWPMLLYQMTRSSLHLKRSVQAMFTDAVPPEMLAHIGDVYRYVHLHAQMPKNATRSDMARFTAPVMLIAAPRDVLFPASMVMPRARAVLPNLVVEHVLPNSNHYPSQEGIDRMNEWLRPFLGA